VKKRIIHNNISIPADNQPTIIAQPGKRSLYFPTAFIPSQLSPIMVLPLLVVAPVRANQLNTTRLEPPSQRVTVISLVSNQSLGVLPRPTPSFSGHGNVIYRCFEELDLRRGRRVQVVSQRNTLAVDHHHPLRSFAPFGLSDVFTPFFAGAKLPSANASLQSSWPLASSSARKTRQAFNQTPCSSHSFKRRQQVEGLGYRLGKSAHGAPVRSIHKMPSNTLRLSAQGRPPLLDLRGVGNKASIFLHCLSVNFRRSLAIEKLLSMAVYHKSLYGASLKCA
jgi:hypothetical protein